MVKRGKCGGESSFRPDIRAYARVGLHDKVKPTTLANIPYRFGELLVVPVERKRHRGTVRIKRGVGVYVVGHEFHRRR